MKRETFAEKWLTPLESTQKLVSSYGERFAEEFAVYYGHSLSYLRRLLIDPRWKPVALRTPQDNLCFLEPFRLTIFLPDIEDSVFREIVNQARAAGMETCVRNVSREYLAINSFFLRGSTSPAIHVHSKEQAIFSTKHLCLLRGDKYASLRNSFRKIETEKTIRFSGIADATETEIHSLIAIWQDIQGKKYGTDRTGTDFESCAYFKENRGLDSFISVAAWKNDGLVGVGLAEIVRPGHAVCVMNKCLNGQEYRGESVGV